MTSHELAKLLLSMKDKPIVHHYYYHEDFHDYGIDWEHTVDIQDKGDKIRLTTKDLIEEN